jgi:hypothetical protein
LERSSHLPLTWLSAIPIITARYHRPKVDIGSISAHAFNISANVGNDQQHLPVVIIHLWSSIDGALTEKS